MSKTLSTAINDRRLAVDALGGGTNLAYKAGLYVNAACAIHCFLDNDDTGRTAIKRAEDLKYISLADSNLAKSPGLKDSEIEDLYDESLYLSEVLRRFGVDLRINRKNGLKWSDRVKLQFGSQGKQWSAKIEMDIKDCVAKLVEMRPEVAIHKAKVGPIDALVRSLELKLSP